MAGDWIKFEHATPDKPEVVSIASALGIDQDAVVGKLFRIWAWADQNSVSGNPIAVNSAFLDRLTAHKGFAEAMKAVGWLAGKDGALLFPNFARHNGRTAKERAVMNRRAVAYRKSNGGTVTKSVQKPLPEKRREEKSTGTHTPGGAGEDRSPAQGEVEDLEAYAVEIGMPASDGTACYNHWSGNGWTNNGKPIEDWRATMQSWKAQGYLASQKVAARKRKGTGRSTRGPDRIPTAETRLTREDLTL